MAKKQYALFSGLLIAWELVGLRIENAYLAKYGISVLSPQALPWVLIVLICYFAFRTTEEWLQCNQETRNTGIVKVGYLVAHGIAVTALVIYCVQRILEIQIADELIDNVKYSLWLGLIALGNSVIASIDWNRRRLKGGLNNKFIQHLILFGAGFIIFVYAESYMVAVAMVTGTVLGFVVRRGVHALLKRSSSKQKD